jgi:hypothetical protein
MAGGKLPEAKVHSVFFDIDPTPYNTPKQPDMVNHPPHYNTGKIEVIEYILDKFQDQYLLGNVCKYISRAKHKGNELQDLEKAQWYLTKAIEECKAKSNQ